MRRVGRKVGFIFAAAYSAGGGDCCTCHHQRLVLDAVCRHVLDW